MQDDFNDVLSAGSEEQEGIRRVLEDRRVGDYALPILHSGHVDIMAAMLACDITVPFVISSGEPGMGKSVHRELMEESGMFELCYSPMDEFIRNFNYSHQMIDEDKNKPEWQKRRDKSARAKADLVKRLKKGK